MLVSIPDDRSCDNPYDFNVNLQLRVATLGDVERVYEFSERRFSPQVSEMERTMALWSVPWRKESLLHYFATGWSFVATRNDEVVGYFMAQPFIHFRGQTQTVWVEHVEAAESEIAASLLEIVVKVAREKHLQRVLFWKSSFKDSLSPYHPTQFQDEIIEVKTTKG